MTEFLYASGSQSHYPLTPGNPHFLQLWRSGKTTTINYAEHTKHLGSRSFSLKQPVSSGQGRILQWICVFDLHSLDLWGLDNRGLCSLNDPMDLNRLSVWELHQCYCGTCCRGVACRHGHLQFRRNVIVLPCNTGVKPFHTGNQFSVGRSK